MKRWIVLLFALCLVGVAASGPSVISSVAIRTTGFSPAVDTINIHDTVKWTNLDEATHTASSRPGSADTWDSGNLPSGSIYSHQFNVVGSFRYQCELSGAQGTIVVISQSPVRATTWGKLKQLFRTRAQVVR